MLPTASNFSDIEYSDESYSVPYYEVDWSEVFVEDTLLSMLSELDNDRERVILLLMAMGKDGYDFKHKDVATMFQIDYSWYMRIVRSVKHQLLPFLDRKVTKTEAKAVKVEEKVQKNIKTR